jgi:hypothetical protein
MIKSIVKEVSADHDVTDMMAASTLVEQYNSEGKEPIGLIYKVARPTLDEQMANLIKGVGGSKEYDVRKIVDLSRP